MSNAVNFGDLCLYYSNAGKLILACLYPGSTIPRRLYIPGINLPYRTLPIDDFCRFLEDAGKDFQKGDLNDLVATVSVDGIVFCFDRSSDDRRIDLTSTFIGTGAKSLYVGSFGRGSGAEVA